MVTQRELLSRGLVGAGIVALLLIIGYTLYVFLAVVVFAVFLYYAVRPLFDALARFNLGRRTRAATSIVLFGLPFLVLTAYSVALVAAGMQTFLVEQDFFQAGTGQLIEELNIAGLDLESLDQLVNGEGSQVSLDLIAGSVLGAASLVGSVLVQLLLVVTATYYLLVDGPRLIGWVLETYDDGGVGQRYVREVDSELSLALFGNIVNVFITAIVAIVTFYAYNVFVAPTVAIPFPALLGALAGIGSLIPVIGIKLVYVPLCIGLAANAVLTDQPELLGPVVVLFVVSGIIVDFIPDFVIRAQVSSSETHTGLLLIAYIVGPTVFGFYGLFLAPIVLILATNAVKVLLPYSLGTKTGVQTTLDEFDDTQAASSPVEGVTAEPSGSDQDS